MINNHPRYLKLGGAHPLIQKFDKLCALADDLQIRLSWQGQTVLLSDDESGLTVHLEDLESPRTWISNFPPSFEYKMIMDNPKYLEVEEQIKEHLRVKREQQLELERAAKEKEVLEAEAKRLREVEEAERYLLAQLKIKYEK